MDINPHHFKSTVLLLKKEPIIVFLLLSFVIAFMFITQIKVPLYHGFFYINNIFSLKENRFFLSCGLQSDL